MALLRVRALAAGIITFTRREEPGEQSTQNVDIIVMPSDARAVIRDIQLFSPAQWPSGSYFQLSIYPGGGLPIVRILRLTPDTAGGWQYAWQGQLVLEPDSYVSIYGTHDGAGQLEYYVSGAFLPLQQ